MPNIWSKETIDIVAQIESAKDSFHERNESAKSDVTLKHSICVRGSDAPLDI